MTSSQQEPYRLILRDISLLEKELGSLENNTSDVDREEITHRMITNCQELILQYPQIATQKNIDNILWKHCYYRNIEAYRKKIRQLSTILEKPYTRTPITDAQYHEYRQNLMKMSASLNQYLSQSAAFYENFLMKLEHLIEIKVTSRETISDLNLQNNLTADIDAYLKSLYFCLLYLGDIARYTELHSVTNKQKDWSAASQYYLRARQVLPSLGNSHNQLAVLCSYKATQNNITPGYLAPPTQMNPPPPASIELNAIYHYCRSILVDYPFQTGVENLKLMFEKSSKRSAAARQSNTMMHQGNSSYDEYDRRMPQQGPYPPSSYYPAQQYHSGGPHGKKPKSHPENPSNLSEFLSLFLSLMSDIFTLSLSELSLSTMLLSCTTESEFKEELVVEHQKLIQRVSNTMGSLLPKILDEFELLFSNLTSQLSAEVLIRILTISLFSIHFTRHELKRKFKQTTITATTTTLMNSTTFFAELQENRFVTESFAISCLFSLVSRLALKLCHPGAIDKSRRRLMIRVIQFVSVFCDWGRMNPYYLHSVNSNATLQNTSNLVEDSTSFLRAIEILRASGEQLRAENRTRSSLRVTVADMKSYLSKLFQNHSNEDSSKLTGSFQSSLDSRPILGHGLSLPLPEYIELRGYIPLNDYEIYFRGIPLKKVISVSYTSEKESASITRRVQNIEEFIDFSLAPPVPPPPVPVPSTTISDAKLKAREERKLRKEARKHEKKLRNQRRKEKRREKSKRSEKRSHERSFQPEDQDLKYLPNDEDFPEIRKFNEVSPSKQKGENLYAAALAAVRGADSEPPRHRKRGESESESESDDEDEESEHESDEDSSHESSMSESESNEVSATHKNESPRQPPIGNQKAAADHDDDDDDADDIIVFQPAFPQLNYSSIDHNLPNSYNSPTPRQHAFTSNNIPQEVSMSTEIVDDDPIDKDSLAYLQALHKKNTEHGWLSNHPTHQDQSTTSKYPFMHDEAHRFDLWNPHHNLEGNLFNYGTNTATESIFAATAAVVDSQHNQPHQWGNGGGDVYAEKVPPPPGFVDLPKSIPSQMEDYQMNPNAFLPTSLRQYPPPGNSQSPPSIFSMLYGSGYDHQDHYTGNWNPPPPPPPGYQMQQHYGT